MINNNLRSANPPTSAVSNIELIDQVIIAMSAWCILV